VSRVDHARREEEDDALPCESVCWAALVLVVGLVVDCGAGLHHGLLVGYTARYVQVIPFLSFLFFCFSFSVFISC
jgi:hypothetical protein